MPLVYSQLILKIYRDVNYDMFCKKGFLQDLEESYSHDYFDPKYKNKTLLEAYFEHFYLDLNLQIGHMEAGRAAINDLKEKLNKLINKMKTQKDYLSFDYEILKNALRVKPE